MQTDFVSGLKSLSLVIVVATAAVGCDSEPAGPLGLPGGLEIRTTANVFNIQTVNATKTATVTATVVNNGLTTVFVHFCGDRIYKRVGADWVVVWAEECSAVDGIFSQLPPGGVRSTSTFLSATGSSLGPPFVFETGAVYAVSVPLLLKTDDDPDEFKLIDPRESISTAFTFAL